MNVKKGKGPVFDPGLCRCCGTIKKCRVLNVEYVSFGQKEIYSDMMMDCYGLLLSHLDSKPSERLVCATCVHRLREAQSFKLQVLKCEEAFIHSKMFDGDTKDEDGKFEGDEKIEVHVKMELDDYIDNDVPNTPPATDALAEDTQNDVKPIGLSQDTSNEDIPLKQLAGKRELRPKVGIPSRIPERPNDVKPIGLSQDTSNDIPSKQIAGKRELRSKMGITRRIPERPKIPMAKLQQRIRERDPSYISETNILTIVEYSYVCPFKCRHNHLLCFYCGEFFSDPQKLRDHTQNSHHPKKFKVTEHKNMIKIDFTRIDCRLCSMKIANLDEFKRHVTSVHNKKYYFNNRDLILPFRLSKDEFKCALCEHAFPYFHALNKHMNEHFRNYVCETCGLGFVDRARFLMHQQRHEEGDFPCEVCGKVFKAQYNRELHVDRVHNKRGRVYCPKCDVRLMTYPQKLKHLVEVHGEEPLSFPCNVCEKVCETRRKLTIHRRKEHLKDYRYDCQFCGQKFFTRFALNNHMPTHTGERNFKCKVCEKTYPRLKTLKDHIRIHTNDRRFRCHICGQAFIQNCSLKGHMKTQHPEYS